MELLFLDEQNLAVLDHACCLDDYQIVLDILIPQKSSFTIFKETLNAENSDYLVIRDNNYFYIGVITSIKKQSDNSIKIETKDFLSILDVEVPLPTPFSGNVATFVSNLITSTFINSGDTYQNLSYLEVVSDIDKSASLTYKEDTKENILNLVEEFSKTYGLRLTYELVLHNGAFSNIRIKIVDANAGIKLRSDLGTITNLVINDTNENSLNKIIYKPKSSNSSHRQVITYYLETDGIVTNVNHLEKRNPKTRFKYDYYSDDDYTNLKDNATKELIDSSLKHNITFSFNYSINQIEPLNDLSIGTFVEFITKEKTYETLVSKVTYRGTLNIAEITLGEYRISLTDKLKLLERRKS